MVDKRALDRCDAPASNLGQDTEKLVPPVITWFLLLTRPLVAIILLIFELCLNLLIKFVTSGIQECQLVQQHHPLDTVYAASQRQHTNLGFANPSYL